MFSSIFFFQLAYWQPFCHTTFCCINFAKTTVCFLLSQFHYHAT